NVTILEALRNRVGDVLFAPGCKLTTNGDSISQNNYQFIDAIKLPSKEANQKLIDEAVAVANQAEFIVLAVGENEQFSREAWNNHPGDMISLDLQSQQEDLVKAIAATGKPYIVYLMHGRPLSINWVAKNSPAIIDGWFSGEEAGNAFANILLGDVNPSGKLTISVPRSVGQLPIYYNARPTSQFYEYVTEKNTPLYPFGYGLSYTTFDYSSVFLKDTRSYTDTKTGVVLNSAKKNKSFVAEIKVTNTGSVKGDEIVQLYVHQKTGESIVRPVKELKGFQRVTLAPGEFKTVSFTISSAMLEHWTSDMRFAIEKGVYEIMIGTSSTKFQKTEVVVQ
ncbi:MAG TPA: glycoside hydrolase family 3 C-terminal domain-containing protein, partial [Chitinophagaceae bacterium]|nr:glycoside hydrolase family 3 C-terminal domain-containing protein [Chitinophagaceae bacterium]